MKIPEKWFPLQGEQAHSLIIFICTLRGWSFQKQNRKEEKEVETVQQLTYLFSQGYNIPLQKWIAAVYVLHIYCVQRNTHAECTCAKCAQIAHMYSVKDKAKYIVCQNGRSKSSLICQNPV